jgi:uncharacterized protein YutE (UPF0331/DUF86 family)
VSNEVIQQKLNSIARCIERLESKIPSGPEELNSDIDLQDIVMINLERLVQLSVDCAMILISERKWLPVPQSMAESFIVLAHKGYIDRPLADRLVKAVGFRNLAVHEYDKINWNIVYRIMTERITDFKTLSGKFMQEEQ